MYEIYSFNDDNGQLLVPSLQYINCMLKMIEDALVSNERFEGFKSIDSNIKNIDASTSSVDKRINAIDVVTDKGHQFISEVLLDTFKDKPSSLEVEQSLDKAKQELRMEINNTYMKIVNTPNVINKLRDIADILHEDSLASGLIETIVSKVNEEQFEEHVKSSAHMTNNDRKALNLFIKFINAGGLDWDANEDSFGYIRNKPDSLPADGGNADTVGGMKPSKIMSENITDIVIGVQNNSYDETQCDIFIPADTTCDKYVTDILNDKSKYIMLFKQGVYEFTNIAFSDVVVKGYDKNLTVFSNADIIMELNATFKDLFISDCTIVIKSGCEVSNVIFDSCSIIFDNASCNTIKECTFNGCTFRIIDNFERNMIIHNRLNNCNNKIIYLGGDNIIEGNIGN